MLIPWSDEDIAGAHALLTETERLLGTEDPDRLLEEIEDELDAVLMRWAVDDPGADRLMDHLFVVRAVLRFRRACHLLRDVAVRSNEERREAVERLIDAVRSAAREHQDWSWAHTEVIAAYWNQAEDPW